MRTGHNDYELDGSLSVVDSSCGRQTATMGYMYWDRDSETINQIPRGEPSKERD